MKFIPLILVSFFLSLSAAAVDAQDSDLEILVTDQLGNPVADAVLVVKSEAELPAMSAYSKAVMSQQNMEFTPHVLAVPKGTEVLFPNEDDFRHHVYSFSKAKQFEIRLYGGEGDKRVVFDKAGAVALGCNIHDNMLGYIFVADSPYVLKTDESGIVAFKSLAYGDYTIEVWHPRINKKKSKLSKAIKLEATGDGSVDFSITLKRKRKNRRANY